MLITHFEKEEEKGGKEERRVVYTWAWLTGTNGWMLANSGHETGYISTDAFNFIYNNY